MQVVERVPFNPLAVRNYKKGLFVGLMVGLLAGVPLGVLLYPFLMGLG